MERAFKKFLNMDDEKAGLVTFDQFIELFNAEPTGETKKVRAVARCRRRPRVVRCPRVRRCAARACPCACAALQLYDLYEDSETQCINIREVMLGLNNFTGATHEQKVRAFRAPCRSLCACVASLSRVVPWSRSRSASICSTRTAATASRRTS
jgi:hypothetical protein